MCCSEKQYQLTVLMIMKFSIVLTESFRLSLVHVFDLSSLTYSLNVLKDMLELFVSNLYNAKFNF